MENNMEGGGIHGIHRRQKFRGSSTLQSKVLITTDPRAPSHLNSRLLGYVTIWSPRVIVVFTKAPEQTMFDDRLLRSRL